MSAWEARAGMAVVPPASDDATPAAGVVAAGFYVHEGQARALLTSAGLFAYHVGTRANYSITARSDDGGSGWAERFSRKASQIDAGALAKVAVDMLLNGAEHAMVYRFLEGKRREAKRARLDF